MTGEVQGREVAQWASEAADAYADERNHLVDVGDLLAATLEQLAPRELQAWEQLTVTLVPDLVPAHLDWAAHLLHLPALAATQVLARMAEDRQAIAAELASIETNPDYVEREQRINEADIRIAELDRTLEPLRSALIPLEQEPMFATLISAHYDTPEYATPWYELAYYRHWKHGDLIVERHGEPRGLPTFAALRERWEHERAARETLEAELQPWFAQRRRSETLIERRAHLHTQLDSLESRHWARTRALVHEHLCALDHEDLLKLLATYEPGLYAAKRIAGLAAKRHYLASIRSEWIDKPRAEIELKLAKARRATRKYRGHHHADAWHNGDALRRKFAIPHEAWAKRRRNTTTACDRIIAFDRYDDYDLAQGVIWWHLMTCGEVKARFIPEVGHYYAQRSSPAFDAHDAHERAVEALADTASTSSSDDSQGLDDVS